jgi:hypothetical protein
MYVYDDELVVTADVGGAGPEDVIVGFDDSTLVAVSGSELERVDTPVRPVAREPGAARQRDCPLGRSAPSGARRAQRRAFPRSIPRTPRVGRPRSDEDRPRFDGFRGFYHHDVRRSVFDDVADRRAEDGAPEAFSPPTQPEDDGLATVATRDVDDTPTHCPPDGDGSVGRNVV